VTDIVKLVPVPERLAEEEAKVVEFARDAAHEEAVQMLEDALALCKARKCRGVVVAGIFEEPNGATAMYTSVPGRMDGIYASGVMGAVHHAAFRLHDAFEGENQLVIPGREP
jgi:hypothetical protein